tara:strand:+ start:200 stop:382 length:183 start_codon:yes stop_codon:yes gene_type:complete
MMKTAMFCILLTAETSAWDMEAKVVAMHETISKCHVALTQHGFNHPNDVCFCVDAESLKR